MSCLLVMNVVKGYFCYSGGLGFQTLEFAHPNYCTVVTVSILLARWSLFQTVLCKWDIAAKF